MKNVSEATNTILDRISQHNVLPIRLSTHCTPMLPDDIRAELNQPVRKRIFFILLVLKGTVTFKIDWQEVVVTENQVLFITPELIHTMPSLPSGAEFYKVTFGKELVSYFPAAFNFFINPFDSNLIQLDTNTAKRMLSVFKLLADVIEDNTLETDLILTYLHSLLTECNSAYFKNPKQLVLSVDNLALFIEFKKYIESSFLEQPTIEKMSHDLGLNTNGLYQLVKTRTGVSPKEFLTERLILEAKRKLYFTDLSIKELAWSLGYTDPGYFSKLFKKHTGKSIPEYRLTLKDISAR